MNAATLDHDLVRLASFLAGHSLLFTGFSGAFMLGLSHSAVKRAEKIVQLDGCPDLPKPELTLLDEDGKARVRVKIDWNGRWSVEVFGAEGSSVFRIQ